MSAATVLCNAPLRGAQIGQSEKEETNSQTIYVRRHQVAETALKGANAGREDREADEKVRGLTEAKGASARPWLG